MNANVEKLALIRAVLQQKSIDAYIIPLSDPHLGEYIPGHWKIIPWLTGFTGSAASVIITHTLAGLWTDSRYFVQAEAQLEGSEYILMKPGSFQKYDYVDWLAENISSGSKIGFDGRIFSISQVRKLEEALGLKKITFDDNCDIITEMWTDRPPMPVSVAWDHPVEYSGSDRSKKIAEVRKKMKEKGADLHLLTSIDDIMWLLNIRGNDVEFSPLLTSFALVGERQILLFVDDKKIPQTLKAEFDKLGIVMLPYEETCEMISFLADGSLIMVNPSTTSVALYKSIPERFEIIEDISIPTRLKSIKNKTEIENLSAVMVKDGVALTKFFFYIDQNNDKVPMTEVSLAVKILELRSHQKDFLGASFATITAFKEHGALPHYSSVPETDSIVGERGLLLVDSGGQYMGGTTDITRTVPIGLPTAREKNDFTLVLKGHIKLAMAKFPYGTRGYQLDHLAREPLWQNGLNYGHGTGHGVGYCLNVHEGPQSISPADNKSLIEPGMLISNEPAIYRGGEYGIRTENLILCYEDEETEFGKFLKFDTLSLCYIDNKLIDISILEKKEIEWLNKYHSGVFEKLSPHLEPDEIAWLKDKTEPILNHY
jgi:Xaa-Pro aminopeptidase